MIREKVTNTDRSWRVTRKLKLRMLSWVNATREGTVRPGIRDDYAQVGLVYSKVKHSMVGW